MATTSEARALPFFTDLYGQPLESGSIYIGQSGRDPVAYPITVYSDIGSTVALSQPIRTVHGHAVSAGAQVHMFCPIPYSITVLDSAGRLVYASLSETDPVATVIATSSVQSANNLAELRARAGTSTNQVWLTGYGMYVYDSTDHTSPEKIPYVIVGNDGSRYKHSDQYVTGPWVRTFAAADPSIQGTHVSWNDFSNGFSNLTNNRGTGEGGFIFRTVNSDNTAEIGRVSFSSTGGISAGADIRAAGNLTAAGGIVAVNSDGSRSLTWDGSQYGLPAAPLAVNGSQVVTQATFQAALLANQQANGVGAVAVGNSGSPVPVLPGSWAATGTASNSVYLWVRVI